MKSFKVFASAIFSFATSCALAAGGGAGGSIVFDPSNFGKNTITAAQTAQQVQEQIQTRLVQLQQLQEYYRQGKSLAAGDINALGSIAGAGELTTRISNMQNMYQAISGLNGNLGNLQSRYSYALQMAQRYGLTLKEYQEKRAAEVKRKSETALLERQSNVAAIQNVQDSYAQVAKWQNSVPDTNTASFQRLNQQMALLNAQNAQLMQHFANQDVRRLNGEDEIQARKDAKRLDAEKESAELETQAANARKSLSENLKKIGGASQ